VFDGNRTDVTNVEEIVEKMEKQYGKAKRVWVMDRGTTSEDNLEWLREDLELVPEDPWDLDVALGFELGPGGGDGPRVEKLPGRSRSRTGLHLGDIITAVAGRPTRDRRDLVRYLDQYEPGDTVELTYRRGRLHGTTEVTLFDANPPRERPVAPSPPGFR